MAAVDLFAPLERVVAKYRRDVHHLAPGASPDALVALEGHLERPLPPQVRQFLARHNGALLFRGLLRIRSTSEIAIASSAAPGVVLFADAQGDVSWAWAQKPGGEPGEALYGRWENGTLDVFHGTFAGWLAGALALLDTKVNKPEDQDSLRLEADPDDAWQLLRAGIRALHAGLADDATQALSRASQLDPQNVEIWQRFGDALAATDRQAARQAWLAAFDLAQFPLPWPGAPCLDADVLRQLPGAYSDERAFEDGIERFLTDRVRDVVSAREADVVFAAARELSRSQTRRGARTRARDGLADLLARARRFAWGGTPWAALVELARLEFDLGHHDETEALLRRLRRDAPADQQPAGQMLLARLAITRQEPWAEEILDDVGGPLLELDQVEIAALHVERAVRQERLDDAKAWVEKARTAATRVSGRAVHAIVALAEADALRLENDLSGALQAIRRGLAALSEKDDPELRFRLLLRQGDMLAGDNRPDRLAEAIGAWQQAAEGFRAHELPVREAWTLLRLARYHRQPENLLRAAFERFAEADLAAGVAAVDALRGDPGLSLAWHLDRATAQARARYDAQRSRPPWERADADRPERRLGAHRLAIAACAEAVVGSLAHVMSAAVNEISTGRNRALDPPVMRYVAAVDLLSAHRSYPAAQMLLDHLLRSPVEGAARRSLQGAIARSPNAALVDGLLSVVENPGNYPADAVAQAAETLGLRREKEAVRSLVPLAAPGAHPISRKAAVAALGRIGNRDVVDKLIPALDDPNLAEPAALSLLMLGDRRGVDFHGRALADGKKDLSGSPGEIVGRYGGNAHMLLLVRVSESGTDERALGALQGLGLLGDPRVVPTLLKALASRDRRVVDVAAGALQIITGHHEDMEEAGARARWQTFWEAKGPRMKDGIRHRDGRVFDGSLLIDKMAADDPWVRRTAYDELVIMSGGNLPFDAEGPWRVQLAHLRAWREWWKRNGGRLMPGRWYLDGAPLG